MKTEDALKIVDGICSQVSLSREQHAQVTQAIQVLREATTPKKEDKK